MSQDFILSCESTIDMPYSYAQKRDLPVLFYTYSVDGVEYEDDMCRNEDALPKFYALLKNSKLPSTSQINEFKYYDFFDKLSEKAPVLHIAFGSGMTPSVKNAVTAAEKIEKDYPGRKVTVIDSLCSSAGYGMLVDAAADMRDNGASFEEIYDWVMENRKRVHHQFFSTDLKFFKRSGRVSGATATIATILDICPIMRLDDKGRIIAYDKIRGKKIAIKVTMDTVEKFADGGKQYSGKFFIVNSDCRADAEAVKKALADRFPSAKEAEIFSIGPIIASHSGPGTVAVFFFGSERQPDKSSK